MKSTVSVTSHVSGISQSQVSQVEVKLKANQTKAQLKNLFRNIDADKKGLVKEEAFFSILQLHGINLSAQAKKSIKKDCIKQGLISYKDAIQLVTVDMDQAADDSTQWVIKNQNQPDNNDTKSVYSHAPSHLSRLNNQDSGASKSKMNKDALAKLNSE